MVLACLSARKIKVPARATGSNSLRFRLQLRSILQLEQEYTRMTLHIRDKRFGASVGILPLERLILCVLHCPMRTHKKELQCVEIERVDIDGQRYSMRKRKLFA